MVGVKNEKVKEIQKSINLFLLLKTTAPANINTGNAKPYMKVDEKFVLPFYYPSWEHIASIRHLHLIWLTGFIFVFYHVRLHGPTSGTIECFQIFFRRPWLRET